MKTTMPPIMTKIETTVQSKQWAKQEDECGALHRRLVSVALGGGDPHPAVEIVILFFGVPFEICEVIWLSFWIEIFCFNFWIFMKNYKLEFERDGFGISTFPASKALKLWTPTKKKVEIWKMKNPVGILEFREMV